MGLHLEGAVYRRRLCPVHAHYGPDEFDYDCPDCRTGAEVAAEGLPPDEHRDANELKEE